MAKDFLVGAILGGVIGGLIVFVGYEKINSIIRPGSVAAMAYRRRKGYFTNHLDIYPYRPASLY